MDSECGYDGGYKDCIQNFGGNTHWNTYTSNSEVTWKYNFNMQLREMDGTGSGSCLMAEFGISSVKHPG